MLPEPTLSLSVASIIAALGLGLKIMADRTQFAKWRGIVETEIKQAKEDREILHKRIDDKEEDTKKKLDKMQECLKELTRKVDILVDRDERKH